MTDLVEFWRSKTDDEVVDAMKDIRGYLPEAQKVIRAEFSDRGLTYRKTYREEKKDQRERKVQDTVDAAKKYLFPTELVAVVRLTGVMCIVSVALSYESVVDPVRWTLEYGDAMSLSLAVLGVGMALWALWAAYSAFKPGPKGWTVLVTFLAASAGASLVSMLTLIFQMFGGQEVVGNIYPMLGIDLSWSGIADQILNKIIALAVWSAALVTLYRPNAQQYMQVSEERRDRTTRLIKRLVIVILALPFVWSIVLGLL